MSGRGRHAATRRRGWRWLAGVTGLAVAGAAVLTMSPAHAAPDPNPNYHPGSDHATFTATGVLDSNCLVSTGGTDVWIKPGDSIDFDSALAGINLASLSLNIGKVVGLNVSATITHNDVHKAFKVTAGGTTPIAASEFSAGKYDLSWTLDSITLLPIINTILGPILGNPTTIQLHESNLNAGASLSWSGFIHVTDSAPTCKLAVTAPTGTISVGPVKVPLPTVSVAVPAPTLPDLGGLLPGGGSKTSGSGHSSAPSSGTNYTPPGLTIPEQVVPKGYGNGAGTVGAGGGFGNALPDLGGGLVNGAPDSGAGAAAPSGSSSPAAARVSSSAADLAANPTPSPQLPVLLAILAIIALSLVTATYARLYLLRRN